MIPVEMMGTIVGKGSPAVKVPRGEHDTEQSARVRHRVDAVLDAETNPATHTATVGRGPIGRDTMAVAV